MSSLKRTSGGTFKSSEQQIIDWLEQIEKEEDDFSGDDDIEDPNFEPEQIEFEDDEICLEDGFEEQNINCKESTTEYLCENTYKGKNGFVWSAQESQRTSRVAAHNIIRLPQLSTTSNFENYIDLWTKFFDQSMLSNLIENTNLKLGMYRNQFKNKTRPELTDTNEIEMKAFIGLLYYSSVFKCNDCDLNTVFANDGTGHEIFRCVMTKYRFSCLVNCLRFDDITTREVRIKSDPLAPISNIFSKFISNSQAQYYPGAYMCIDEMLVPFRGRCKFVIYMPQKPAKYGLKIMILCDAKTFYIYNAYVYYGKNSDGIGLNEEEKQLSVPSQSVLRLVKVIEGTNRNITADNWFSSIPLMEALLKKNLTYLGTMKKNKREIPKNFLPCKNRDVGSSLYGFTKNFTLLSFVPKKNKAVLLVSSSHHFQEFDTESEKPIMIVDYNRTKGGVDEIDKKCSIYSSSRKTRRWPMAIFYRVLDMIGINCFVVYQTCKNVDLNMRRRIFLLNMAREMVLDHMKARVYNERLPRELRMTISRVLGKDLPPPPPKTQSITSSTRKLCYICPSKIKRKTKYSCCSCLKPICLQCSSPICENCIEKKVTM